MRIGLLDDRQNLLESWAEDIRESIPGADIDFIDNEDLPAAVGELRDRQRDPEAGGDCRFDRLDVLIADYDLREAEVGLTTGADVARLVRCYSRCTVIVLMNAFPSPNRARRFDLRLVGNLELFSDVETGSDFIGNPGLWTDDRTLWPAFRPWSWPALPSLVGRLSDLEQRLRDNLDELVIDMIPGLAEQLSSFTPDEAEWLGEEPQGLRVRDLSGKDEGSTSVSLLAPVGRDIVPDPILPLYAAARLVKWLDQFVLVRQVALADAPHLVSRYPALLKDRDRLVEIADPRLVPAELLLDEFVAVRAPLDDWVSRPVWWTDDILSSETLQEATDPGASSPLDDVFCEDVSDFLDRHSARDFVLPVPSSHRRRWVSSGENLDGYEPDYQPAQWLTL